jgi:two-component system repressor protein LuxO
MPLPAEHAADDPARLLLIGRDAAATTKMAAELELSFAVAPEVECVHGGGEAATLLKARKYDLVLAELNSLNDLAAQSDSAVARLVRLAAEALVIVLSDGGSVSAAVAAMRAGAHDCIPRPLPGPELAARIAELAQRHGKSPAFAASSRRAGGPRVHSGFVGTSPQMQVVFEQIDRIATASAPAFITGESGTGKDVCAEALHDRSTRSGGRFVAVDCASIPQDLMERELFGVAPGAHSGVQDGRKGATELADGGTLYLDEIAAVGLSLQAKLLRFLHSGTVQRMGDDCVHPVDVRVICATRHNPMQLIAERQLREDLFYQLHVLPIHLPPLRQRPGDIPGLARHFLGTFSREEHKTFTGFSDHAAARLAAHGWPGNVRQLKNLIRRVVVMYAGGEVSADMVAAADAVGGADAVSAQTPAPVATVPRVLPMWRQEQRIIEDAIASFGGNVAMAAAALELSPSTIYRKRQAWLENQERRGAA